jgi:hypothetical protein
VRTGGREDGRAEEAAMVGPEIGSDELAEANNYRPETRGLRGVSGWGNSARLPKGRVTQR